MRRNLKPLKSHTIPGVGIGERTAIPLAGWRYAPLTGNRLTLFTDGDEAYEAVASSVRTATTRVWLETYIFEPDEVGNRVRDLLAEAAARGCDVILLFDRWGSPRIGLRYARSIVEAGGRVAVYNPMLPWRKLGRKIAPVFHRDHRKVLIVDDVGFCGGANVSRDYTGSVPHPFFDLTLKLEGPSVRDLASAFLASLRVADDRVPPTPRRSEPLPNGQAAQVLVHDRRTYVRDLDLALMHALQAARDYCFLMTPYFIPSRWFKKLLVRTAGRGVDVRLLTAGRSDVPFAQVAGRHLYGRLLRAGVRVFEMQDPILHAKCFVIDGRFSIVGSYNFDRYGGKHNQEIGIGSWDPALARRLRVEFERRTADAHEVDLTEWRRRPLTSRVAEWALFRLLTVW